MRCIGAARRPLRNGPSGPRVDTVDFAAAPASVVHGYFIRLINSLLCRLHQRRSENPRFLDVVFRKHNDPKILLNVNLLTSRSFWSRIHAPRSRRRHRLR
jgi:hypothetical protein